MVFCIDLLNDFINLTLCELKTILDIYHSFPLYAKAC